MSVSPKDREKAIWTTSSALAEVFNIGTNPNARAEAEHVIDVLVALGWGPGGARPTRDELAEFLWLNATGHEHHQSSDWVMAQKSTLISVIYAVSETWRLADALLAADHLWTEHPSECAANGEHRGPLIRDAHGLTLCKEHFGWYSASAPVVDREALAQALHAISDEARFISDLGRLQIDLNAAPDRAVIIDKRGDAWQKSGYLNMWFRAFDGDAVSSFELAQRAQRATFMPPPEAGDTRG